MKLAAASTPLIGRQRELGELESLVRRSRLVTLLGPGGAGKTRLALELGGRVEAAYPDGVWLVELASLADEQLVTQTVATALKVREQPGHPLDATLIATLASRRMLLVLDNCEHVASAVASLTETLLRACPGLTVVATSREVLQVRGEVVFPVAELSLPQVAGSAADIRRSEAVQLFVARAAATDGRFELTDSNAQAIAGICRRVDGNALAIELAARRVGILSVHEILDRLDDRFQLLTGGARTAATRHQDLRTAIDWSYQLLDQAEQAVFRRLSVLADGFTLDGAAAVAADDGMDVLALITDLEAKSLIVPTSTDRATARFRQLESIRLYAREQLAAAGEEEATWLRATGWLTGRAATLNALTYISGDLLTTLEEESGNLVAVLDWARRHGDDRQLPLAAMLARCWRLQGHENRGRALLREVLGRTADAPAEFRGMALAQEASHAYYLGDHEECHRLAAEAFALARQAGRPRLEARALQLMAFSLQGSGDSASAYHRSRETLDALRKVGDPLEVALAGQLCANLGMHAGAVDEAAAFLAESLPTLLAPSVEPWLQEVALQTAGILALAQDDLDAADSRFRAGLEPRAAPSAQAGSWSMARMVSSLEGLAIVASRRGRPERALLMFSAVTSIMRDLGDWGDAPFWHDPLWTDWIAESTAVAAGQLGARAAAARAAGRKLTVDQVVEYALTGRLPTDRPGRLPTDREIEIAALVARGLTNRQIAGRLEIVERTVEAHVENVRTKLDLASRSAVAAWAVAQRINPSGS